MQKLTNPLLIIFISVVLRLLPHPPNFAPITAMALFGGAYLNKRYALVVPLLAMFISDLYLGFHSTIFFVYGSFLFSGAIGLWLRAHKSLANVAATSLTCSVVFFIITNLGVWLTTNLYPHTINGLIKCFVLAIPFFRNTLLGDLFYTTLFFGSFELATKLTDRKKVYGSVNY